MAPDQRLIAAGEAAGRIHDTIEASVKEDVNLLDIEDQINRLIKSYGMTAAFLGYKGYRSASCLSVNSAVVHAPPKNYQLQSGDVLSVDLGVKNDGWIVDTARTHPVGGVSQQISELLAVTKRALDEAIQVARIGNRVGDIGHAVQQTVEGAGFYIIKELTGHGIGKKLQLPPSVPNFGRKGTGIGLNEGDILAIEPITALRPVRVTILDDNWTIQAHPADVVCVHFEHTIYIGKDGPIVLTKAGSKG